MHLNNRSNQSARLTGNVIHIGKRTIIILMEAYDDDRFFDGQEATLVTEVDSYPIKQYSITKPTGLESLCDGQWLLRLIKK